MFKKRNLLSKLYLKYTNRVKYKEYKWEYKNYKQEEVSNYFTGSDRLTTLEAIRELSSSITELNFNHSGNAGDIIYALPTIKRISEVVRIPVNLYLKIGQPLVLSGYKTHPLGGVMLNQKMVDMLAPFLNSQNYIHKCEAYNNQKIHIDLDFFRSNLIPLGHGNIARWCGYITGVTPELWRPWLTVEPDNSYKDKIVIARSERYRNPAIDYSFLKSYNPVFIGVLSEYEDMQKSIPNIEWVKVDDFGKMARIIAGCKFFIGNQSFPFALAEGLKVPRILEVYYHAANVIPEGENANDFFFQKHFESLVRQLSGITS